MTLILASQSPYRRAQLKNFGLAFETCAPLVDEEKLKFLGSTDLGELADCLARAKAESLVAKFPGCLIIGGDQIAELDGERFDKPGTRAKARLQLEKLRGRTHRLLTALCLVADDRSFAEVSVTSVTLRNFSDDELDAYLDLDQPFDCAGSYKIERAGLGLVEFVQGHDPSSIQGLPLLTLVRGLHFFKLNLNDLWSKR